MIYYAFLNNYEMGSYRHSVMSMKIISEERINPAVTKVYWDLEPDEHRLLQKALGSKKLKEGRKII